MDTPWLRGGFLDKGLDIACAGLNIEQRFVVYPDSERFPMRDGTQAIGLVKLMQLLQKLGRPRLSFFVPFWSRSALSNSGSDSHNGNMFNFDSTLP